MYLFLYFVPKPLSPINLLITFLYIDTGIYVPLYTCLHLFTLICIWLCLFTAIYTYLHPVGPLCT